VRDIADWVQSEDGRKLLGDTPVVVIAEYGGERGRVHAHGAIRDGYRLDYAKIIRSYSAFMESRGYHSTSGVHRWHAGDDDHKHGDGFRSARHCAVYLAKYLTKFDSRAGLAKHSKSYRVIGGSPLVPDRVIVDSMREAQQLVMDTFGCLPVYFRDPDGHVVGFWFDSGGT